MGDTDKNKSDYLEKLVEERTAELSQEILRCKEKEAQYLALVESINGYVWETDADLTLTYISSRVKDILGYHADSLIGETPLNYSPPGELDRYRAKVQRIVAGKKAIKSFSQTAIHKDGSLMHLEVNGAPFFDDKGNFLGYRGSAHDVTGRERAFEELKLREEELKIKSQNLEEVNLALRVLLKQREKDRKDIEDGFLRNIKQMVLPYIEKLRKGAHDAGQRALADIAIANLNEIISPFLNAINRLGLTPREVQIAFFVREGKTTREIAEIMGVAPSAIDSHRDNIRKKLGLNKVKTNLRTYLLTLE